ncbi:ubiquinol-cytochrome c reductase iron-sulfur subunit [Isoptericola sp. BMS4]|uniref:QcrA and Rieske domain-containing protein n=1 Tax=Isoptericola sp. BMS4 TaxID=2527875 RepID=UPI00196AD365|nr:Rieske (2Fe-2S) protein [Isoptericola sp. BMS4]
MTPDPTPPTEHGLVPAPAPVCSHAGACAAPSRRQVLRGAGAAAGAVAGAGLLAACTEGRQEPGDAAASAEAEGSGTVVVALADVPVGGAVAATVGGQDVLVTRTAEDEVHAFSAVCTHAGCTVAPGEGELVCPCHQSRYALADAAVLGGPAPEPLAVVDVTVSGQDVVLA